MSMGMKRIGEVSMTGEDRWLEPPRLPRHTSFPNVPNTTTLLR